MLVGITSNFYFESKISTIFVTIIPGSSNGKTTDSDPVYIGSIPLPGATDKNHRRWSPRKRSYFLKTEYEVSFHCVVSDLETKPDC